MRSLQGSRKDNCAGQKLELSQRSLPGTCPHVDCDTSELGSAGLATLPPEYLVGRDFQVGAVTIPHMTASCAAGIADAAHQKGQS